MSPRAWVLNLDADLELAGGRGYTPRAGVGEQMALRMAQARRLLGPGDVQVEEADVLPEELRGLEGHAFCMTPRARRILKAAGARPIDAPPVEVLATVNHRAFCASLGQTLSGAHFVHSVDEVANVIGTSDRPWLLKRSFSIAGKGQRRVFGGRLEKDDVRWVRSSLKNHAGSTPEAGLQVEPYVEVSLELSLHGMVYADHRFQLGAPVIQICDDRGAWKSTRPAGPFEISRAEEGALREEGQRVAVALTGEGYFGPFGVDAFRFTDDRLDERFNPRSEINARYTMGWSLGDLVANDPVLE